MRHSFKKIYIGCYLCVGNLLMIQFDDVRGEVRVTIILVILDQILPKTLLSINFNHPFILTPLVRSLEMLMATFPKL